MREKKEDVLKPWLLHLADDDIELVCRMVAQAREAFVRLFASSEAPSSISRFEAVAPRAIDMQGSKRSARIVLDHGRWHLQAPATRAAHRNRFNFYGPASQKELKDTDVHQATLDTLSRWSEQLSRKPTLKDRAEAQRVRSDMAMLLEGIVESHDKAWRNANAHSSGPGRHSIAFTAAERGKVFSFSSSVSSKCGGRMSPQLVAAFDRIVGDRVHVAESYTRAPGNMPGVMVGITPTVFISNTGNPMHKMRGLHAVPPGARLLSR